MSKLLCFQWPPNSVVSSSFVSLNLQHILSDITFYVTEILPATKANQVHQWVKTCSLLRYQRNEDSNLQLLMKISGRDHWMPVLFRKTVSSSRSYLSLKRGYKSLPVNYRPISLTSHTSKHLKEIRITGFLGQNHLLNCSQQGLSGEKNRLT